MYKYATRDNKYTISAIPITTSKFGPSGSLKSANNTREHAMDVNPRIKSEASLDLKSICNYYSKPESISRWLASSVS